MTNFSKVSEYYDVFDEWSRFDTPEGRLEFERTLGILRRYLVPGSEILDLGGGPGRYSIELAGEGHQMHLADLSQTLLKQAEERIRTHGITGVKSIRRVNAVDLSVYGDEAFDAVLLMGPLYHLTGAEQRKACIKEVNRVLKKGGLVFAAFIPYLCGAVGVADRMFLFSDQVNAETLKAVFSEGVFHNNADAGFQEGYYPRPDEVTALFRDSAFKELDLCSVRSWGYGREEKIYRLKEKDGEAFQTVLDLIEQTAREPAILEMGGHAVYIGQKI